MGFVHNPKKHEENAREAVNKEEGKRKGKRELVGLKISNEDHSFECTEAKDRRV